MFAHLVYASAALVPLSQDELLDVLRISRRNNAASGVTGALLYSGGNFLQILEGPAERVEEVYTRLGKDPRHRGLTVLLRDTVDGRHFPDWAMGFTNADRLSEEDRAGIRPLFDLTQPGPLRAHKLMAAFRALAPSEMSRPL